MRPHRSARCLVTAALAFAACFGELAGTGAAHAATRGNLATRVEGTVTSGPGSFDGSLVVGAIELGDGKLVARGSLDGTVTGADGKAHEMAPRDVTLALDRAALAATCDQAHVRLQGTEIEGGGARVRLQPVELEIAARASATGKLHDALCELSRLLANQAADAALAKQLGVVLDALQ
jgi:hypothetical protein